MIPPPRYRQQSNTYSRSLLTSFMSEDNNFEYILEEDGLRIQTVFVNRFTFIRYSDIQTIRLDYKERKSKYSPTRMKFLCYINTEVTIQTEWLSQGIFSSKLADIEYNKFVEMLHLKLQNAPNETRTFHTGWIAYHYNLLRWAIFTLWLFAVCLGICALINGNFEPSFIFGYGVLLIFSISATMDNAPTPYSSRHIPSRFLS